MNYIINNLEGIKNQKDKDYKVHCSMEGHVNQAFARYITSSPYAFSEQGLENKLKLLVYHANKHELTIQDYYNLKYGKDNYEEYTLYTDLQRGCFGDLTNGEEVTGYLPESGAYLAEDAINAALNTAQSIVSDLDSKLVSDDLDWTKGGYIIFTSQPVRRG